MGVIFHGARCANFLSQSLPFFYFFLSSLFPPLLHIPPFSYTSAIAAGSRASAVEFNTTDSDITFGGTVKGQGDAKARSLTVDAGTGDVTFGDRVGYAFNDENFNADNTADSFYKMTVTGNEITVKGDVMTYEEQTYNGNVLVGSTASNGTTRTFLSMMET